MRPFKNDLISEERRIYIHYFFNIDKAAEDEKAFNDLKDRLGMRRTLVASQKSLEGKLFVLFIALIYVSYIKKKMQDENLLSSYSIQSLLDTLDVIDCVQMPGKRLHCGELLEKQKVIYEKLGFSPPSSL